MTILKIYETSYRGMYKITAEIFTKNEYEIATSQKTTFFARQEYLLNIKLEDFYDGLELSDSLTGELLDAGIACSVELKALEYIARCEQSKFGLTKKLTEKKFERKYIQMALDYLETTEFLDDLRYSKAWLHTRQINHFEGKTKLIAELTSRGINKDIAQQAVSDFFTENDEMAICQKAYEKFLKKGKSEEKLIASMMQAGFSYKQIKECKKNEDEK